MLRATLSALALLSLAACDLSAAALSYTERYCAAIGCAAEADAGDDAGALPQRAETVLFRSSPGATFLVVRLDRQPESSGGDTVTVLEERRLADGVLVASEPLQPRGLGLSATSFFNGGLSRAGDGRSVVVAVYDVSRRVADVVSETTVRRVLVVRRGGLDWSTAIADAFQGEQVFSAATQDGSTFWVSGYTGATSSALHEVALGSAGTTRFVLQASPYLTFVSAAAGRLLTSRWLSPDGGPSAIDELGEASAPLDAGTLSRLFSLAGQQRVAGFAALDLNPSVAGPDVVYVASSSLGLVKLVYDGVRWEQRWAASSKTSPGTRDGCLHVAARREGAGTVVLCTAEDANARDVVRFDDLGSDDAGPSSRLLVRIEDDGRDGGLVTVLRGVALSPD